MKSIKSLSCYEIKILVVSLIISSVSLSNTQDQIVFFSDSPDGDELYDSSWGFEQAPSELELAGNNDKFPVDPKHPYQGAHSLRLHWTSRQGGDWGVAVASQGWQRHDFTEYDTIAYWINGPEAIEQDHLPDLRLEDTSNNKSTRVWLGDYLSGVDNDSTTWQRVTIPVDAFQPGTENTDFTRIKTIYYFQKPADETEHLAWIDEIRIIKGPVVSQPPATPSNLSAQGADARIDLKWRRNTEEDLLGYTIYRSESHSGTYSALNPVAHTVHLYSDYFDENEKTYYYYVTAVNQNFQESEPSDTVSATSYAMTEDELITSVQEATFRYFYDYGHPVSGLARERKGSGVTCTSGGTGFGLMALVIGAERGFAPRDSVAARVQKILTFLQENATTYHGVWAHWINGATGETIPFSQYDNGGDLVETAYLIQGALTARKYFDLNNPVENDIRQLATAMWEGVEWDWYRRTTDGMVLYWHWSPNYGWQMNMPVIGWNECMMVYLLAIASPTHSVPASLYANGWAGSPYYTNGKTFYGYKQYVGKDYGGPLFFTHYSFLGFDPRNKQDQFCNYFENNRNTSLIHRAYCMENPLSKTGYDSLTWGLTASDNPWGYSAHEPMTNDNGTITPTAALSAMPYTPEESKATLKHFYYTYGPQLWGEFGFKDAFNPGENWFAQSYIAIDQGPIIIMIENYRTQLCWDLFMSNQEIKQMLDDIGFTTGIDDKKNNTIKSFKLYQNYPNPFNPRTVIQFSLPRSSSITIEIYNTLGKKVNTLINNKELKSGRHQVVFQGEKLASGVYFYKLITDSFCKIKKMVLVR
ncbi:MAG: glucoamylase family protein [bacterium]